MRSDFSWTDEVLDPEVDTMLKLIDEGFRFRKDMFTGSVTAQDLYRIKVERQREKEAKENNDRDNADTHETNSPDQNSPLPIANIVADILKDQFGGLERRLIDAMSSRFEGMERNIEGSVVDGIMSMQTVVIKALSNHEHITRTAAPRRPIQPQTQPTPEGGGLSPRPHDNTESRMADDTIRDVLGDLGSPHNRGKVSTSLYFLIFRGKHSI